MNILLFAPALGFLLLKQSRTFKDLLRYGLLIIVPQILMGLPFLLHNWRHYFFRAFQFSRVFDYVWTVNWKFISEETFLSKSWAITLLVLHISILCLALHRFFPLSIKQELLRLKYSTFTFTSPAEIEPIRSDIVVSSFFICNFIGITFSRTLHYQFYSWYYFTLPYLLWKTNVPDIFKIALLLGIEYAFNVYPATALSSFVLQFCQITLLIFIFLSPSKRPLIYLDPLVAEEIIHHLNREHKQALQLFAMYYAQLPARASENAIVTSIDSFELSIYLPNMKNTLLIGFGQYAPITNPATAKKAIISLAEEAKMAFEELKVVDESDGTEEQPTTETKKDV